MSPTPISLLITQNNKNRQLCCVDWPGYVSKKGYPGSVQHKGRREQAHRIAYRITYGDIPQGMVVDHLCFNRRCVNPLHLSLKTRTENTMRSKINPIACNARKKKCPQGHFYTQENTCIYRGSRYCRLCIREKRHIYYRKNRARLLIYHAQRLRPNGHKRKDSL